MVFEVKEALDEIQELPPMYRRDYIIEFVRKNLSYEEAKSLFFNKDKLAYINRMRREGYASGRDLLDTIGKERILQYFHIMSRLS
jgi:hypothetical protein